MSARRFLSSIVLMLVYGGEVKEEGDGWCGIDVG